MRKARQNHHSRRRSLRAPGEGIPFGCGVRGEGLGETSRTPTRKKRGVAPLDPVARDAASTKTAEIAKAFLAKAREVLKNDAPANFFTMRGIDKRPAIPTFHDVYGLKAAAIAVYPMYRGLARLVNMDVLDAGQTLDDQCARLEQAWKDYDFFFLHYKYTDSTARTATSRRRSSGSNSSTPPCRASPRCHRRC